MFHKYPENTWSGNLFFPVQLDLIPTKSFDH